MSKTIFGLPAAVTLGLVFYLNWNVLSQPPFFDEMWRMNLIATQHTIAKLLASDTPVPIGWLYLNKATFFAIPDSFGLARILCAIWLAFAASLLVRTICNERPDWRVFAGAVFMATCAAIQGVTRNINQYSFELLYSAAIVAISTLQLDSLQRRLIAFTILALTPLAATTSAFFLPGALLVLFVRAPTRRIQYEITAAGFVSIALAIVIYVFVYQPMLTENGRGVIGYWANVIVKGDPRKYVAVLSSLPWQITTSILGPLPNSSILHALIIALTLSLIGLGFLTIWQRSRPAALTMACAAAVALVFPLVVMWPLELFGWGRRINIGWAWMLYFCFGIGLATAFTLMLRPAYSAIAACIILLLILAHTNSFAQYSPDRAAFRNLYRDISAALSAPKPPQMIVQFHFMARCYAEFLIRLKARGDLLLVAEPDRPEAIDETFLSEVRRQVEQHPEVQRISMFYPFDRGPEFWGLVQDFSLDGFARNKRHALGSNVLEFTRSH
jgi:hypothetical protein